MDFIIYIVLGAILGEAIVNNIPLLPSMIICTLIAVIYRFLAYLAYKSHAIGKYVKGDKVLIIKNGNYQEENLRGCQLTPRDILQSLRVKDGKKEIAAVEEAYLERDGQISFIFK